MAYAARRFAAYPHAARSALRAFVSDTVGATAIEYGLIAALIVLAIMTTLALLTTRLENMYTTIGNAVTGS
jgi:pilus assembly protein Flp/PilA